MEGLIQPPIALNFRKGTRTSDYQSNEPPPNFILSPFYCRVIYYHPFIVYLIYPQGITYNPCPEGCGGDVILKDIISGPFNILNKMAISKFCLAVFGEMVGVGGGLVAIRSLSTIKKGTDPFNFQSNELF